MKDVSQGEGRTVLFVSHNMTSVKSLCKTGILLDNGILKEIGNVDGIVSHYLRGGSEIDNYKHWDIPQYKNGGFELQEIGIRPKGGTYTDLMRVTDELELVVRYRLTEPKERFWLTFHMKNEQGEKIFSFSAGNEQVTQEKSKGEYEQICNIPANFLNWGNYAIDFHAIQQLSSIECLVYESDMISFTLSGRANEIGGYMGKEPGDVTPRFDYTESKL